MTTLNVMIKRNAQAKQHFSITTLIITTLSAVIFIMTTLNVTIKTPVCICWSINGIHYDDYYEHSSLFHTAWEMH